MIRDPGIKPSRCSRREQVLDGFGTLPKTNMLPLKIDHSKRKLVFQPSIFGCYVSFRECSYCYFSSFWNILQHILFGSKPWCPIFMEHGARLWFPFVPGKIPGHQPNSPRIRILFFVQAKWPSPFYARVWVNLHWQWKHLKMVGRWNFPLG